MSEAHIRLLSTKTRCPACEAARVPAHDLATFSATTAEFECSAAFCVSNDAIIVSVPCPARSLLAAKLMTIGAGGS
ncbi:hypothetical protein HGO38_01400 [Rhizobium sp. CG5]|uniref:hypothetical protein n=1 Tax=Rhizobium sp. CG5 TaxID=2726076 RepID=UPI00203354F8|nr:hypothetical protein [Rhizobium sp. CG5]MCM2472131.1 hypothetical protein [Rhizobium sp. CG5]